MEPQDRLDIYDFIPPPPPLMPKERLSDYFPHQELDTSRRDNSPRRIPPPHKRCNLPPKHSSNRSDVLAPLPPLCLCKSPNDDFIRLRNSINSPIRPIPLSYKDDGVYEGYSESAWVYKRTRPADFKSWLDSLLDPNLPTYMNGDSVPISSCPVHRAKVAERNSQRSAALAVGEFTFDSEFEGGNLDRVALVKPNEYHLFLTCDSNTKGYTQWFYFSVRNVRKGAVLTVSIMNLAKSGSPFGRGMRPGVLSLTRLRRMNQGWTKGGVDVRYGKSPVLRQGKGAYSALTFSYVFQHDHDTVYFSYSEPYSYSRLLKFLEDTRKSIRADSEIRYEERTLAETIGGLQCPLLVISDCVEKEKKKVGITARVHPGETVGSFLAEGLVSFVLSDCPEAAYLRRNCCFYVIPMLNPDGVVLGNTRTCLSGCDLNRKWDSPQSVLHPVISRAKEVLAGAACFVDLHGHSKKENAFLYGNAISRSDERFWSSRFLPISLAKLCPHFSYAHCHYFNNTAHNKAARTVMYTEKGTLHSFTLETSFHGSRKGDHRTEFMPVILREIGWKLGEAIYGLVSLLLKRTGRETQESVYALVSQLLGRIGGMTHRHTKSAALSLQLPAMEESSGDIEPEENQSSSGSESDPSADELDPEEKAVLHASIAALNSGSSNVRSVDSNHFMRLIPSSYHFHDPLEEVSLRNRRKTAQKPYLRSVRPALLQRQLRERRGEMIQTSRAYVEVLRSLRRAERSLDRPDEDYVSFVRAVRRESEQRLPPV